MRPDGFAALAVACLSVACSGEQFGGQAAENPPDASAGGATGSGGSGPDNDAGSQGGAGGSTATDGRAEDACAIGDDPSPCKPGVFVSDEVGLTTNPGTRAAPVKTIADGIAKAAALGGDAAVYVAGGHYAEKITMTEAVDLLGGYECSQGSCRWSRDAAKNDTAILDTDLEGLLAPVTVTRKTRLDGFRIEGLAGLPTTAPGGVAVTIKGATVSITNCRINGANIAGGAAASSIALRIVGPMNDPRGALVRGNVIRGGSATQMSKAVLFDADATPAPATPAPAAIAELTDNRIVAGVGQRTIAVHALTSGAGTSLRGNDIVAGDSTNGTTWGIDVAGTMLIDANRINAEPTMRPRCTSPLGWSGGIVSNSATAVITNNVVFGVACTLSAGVMLAETDKPAGPVTLNSNYLDGWGPPGDAASSTSVALFLKLNGCATCGVNVVVGRVRNNILMGGAGTARFCVLEDGGTAKTVRPEALDNNDLFFTGRTARDVLYRRWSEAFTDVPTIDAVNQLTMPRPQGNFSQDPGVDQAFHLIANPPSPCINAGSIVEAPLTDIDGDRRPAGASYDVGVDEAL